MKKTAPSKQEAAPVAPQPAAPAAGEAGATPEQLADLRASAARAEENWERLLRTTADFENFKKRAARERQDAIRYANEALMEKLVPVLDHFDMAIAAAQPAAGDTAQSLHTGVQMIHQQLKAALADAGLEEVDALGQMFDPNRHEAISQQEHPQAPEGQVIQQLRKGYKLRDRLLRPASVIVAKAPTDAAA
jgi:molecular chaperone GrpE